MSLNIAGLIKELKAQVTSVEKEYSSIAVPENLTDTQQTVLIQLIKRTMMDLADLKGNIISYQGKPREGQPKSE